MFAIVPFKRRDGIVVSMYKG